MRSLLLAVVIMFDSTVNQRSRISSSLDGCSKSSKHNGAFKRKGKNQLALIQTRYLNLHGDGKYVHDFGWDSRTLKSGDLFMQTGTRNSICSIFYSTSAPFNNAPTKEGGLILHVNRATTNMIYKENSFL